MPGFRVFALDLPGHGKSPGSGKQSISDYVLAIIEWLEAIGLYRAVFVGHSMGGAIALTLALEEPARVAGLALLGSAARLQVNPVLLDETSNPATFANAIEKVIAWSFSPMAPQSLTTLVARRMATTRPSVLHGDFLACNAFDVTPYLSRITCPALIVCGEQDRMTPLRHSRFLADNLPDAHLEVIPGAGHMVMLEKAADVASVLQRFLAEIS
jgi:pimeloyl-ACP methyl ester carboxylesterase